MRPMKNVDYERLTDLGSRIVAAAKARSLHTQADIAREMGVSRAVINQWLYDPNRKPDGIKMLELAIVLRCSPFWLAGLSKDMTEVVPATPDEKRLLRAYKGLRPTERDRLLRDAQERADEEREASTPRKG